MVTCLPSDRTDTQTQVYAFWILCSLYYSLSILHWCSLQPLNRTVTGPIFLFTLLWVPGKSNCRFSALLTQFSYLLENIPIIFSSGTTVSGIPQQRSDGVTTTTSQSSLCKSSGSCYGLLSWLYPKLVVSAQCFTFLLHTYTFSQALQTPTVLQYGSSDPKILTLALWTQHAPLN